MPWASAVAKTAIATMGDVAAKGDTPLEERAIKITDKSDWVGNVFFREDDAELGNKMPEFTIDEIQQEAVEC